MWSMASMQEWLGRLHHDLVKRVLWPARDRRDLGGTPAPGELVPRLLDDEGRPVGAEALWLSLRAQAPPEAAGSALDAFGRALAAATAAAEKNDLAGVLALEAAFQSFGAALAGGR
jgi:hypothetical protein